MFIVRVRTHCRGEPDCATDREVLLPDPTFPPTGLSLDGPGGNQCPPLPVYISWVGKTLGSKSECMTRPANGNIPLGTIINKGGGRTPHLNQEGPDPGLLIKCLGKKKSLSPGMPSWLKVRCGWPICHHMGTRSAGRRTEQGQRPREGLHHPMNIWVKSGLGSMWFYYSKKASPIFELLIHGYVFLFGQHLPILLPGPWEPFYSSPPQG